MPNNSTKRRGAKASRRPPQIDYDNAAELITDLLKSDNLPPLIKDTIDELLTEAQNQTQIMIMIPDGYDRPQLAKLLRHADRIGLRHHSDGLSTTAERERKSNAPKPTGDLDELAQLLSAVLNHPLLPTTLVNYIGEGMCELFNELSSEQRVQIENAPAHIANMLKATATNERKGGR